MQVESAPLFESPEHICARVYRELKPRGKAPEILVEFRPFANANSFIRMEEGRLHLRITDVLEGAPAPILESLVHILFAKLLRRPVPRLYAERYRRYMNRKEMRRSLHLLRQIRGRKFVSGPRGDHYDLSEIFETLNARYFHGLMGQPLLGWSRKPSRHTLGHFDPSHNAVILNRILDRPQVPRLAVEYVLFHEMLHLTYPTEHGSARRSIHTQAFRQAEKNFEGLAEAKAILRTLR